MIAENGSVVQYQGEVLFADVMTQEQYAEVAEKILANPHYLEAGMVFSGQKAAYVLKGASQEYIQKTKHYYANVKVVDGFEDMENDTIFKVSTNFTGDTVLEGSDWLNQALPYATAVTTGFDSIDIILKEVNKCFGMDHLCLALGLSLQKPLLLEIILTIIKCWNLLVKLLLRRMQDPKLKRFQIKSLDTAMTEQY